MWEKKGLLFKNTNNSWWTKSHVMLPTIDKIYENKFRIYYSSRDKFNRSHIGCSEIEILNSEIKLIRHYDQPVFSIGELGTFDDNGVTPSCIINHDGYKYLYYIGWNSGSTTRMSLIAGLAKSIDGGLTFKRVSKGPLLERTNIEPYSILTAPYVLFDNNIWRMFYVSCDGWRNKDLPTYNIKYAESYDGLNWKREGHVCIDYNSINETALARPWVIKDSNKYKMWFSYKDPKIGYRIGYAESVDAKNWKRIDKFCLDVSESGWDSQMVEYSCVFDYGKYRFMLYNGNDYGKSGLGYAVIKL